MATTNRDGCLEGKIYFFVGTIAELIKLIPVMKSCEDRNLSYQVVASGQNDVTEPALWRMIKKEGPDLFLHKGPIKQHAIFLLLWFLVTLTKSLFSKEVRSALSGRSYLIVHGDTVSTLMGAAIGRFCKARICHVEAGLRSFHLLRPFPEEICRILTSQLTHYSFCPNAWAVKNLESNVSEKINTYHNTLIDSLRLALGQAPDSALASLLSQNYFIFVLHRQENLFQRDLICQMISRKRN